MAGSATFDDHPSKLLKVGKGFSLKALDPGSTPGYDGDKPDGEELLDALDDKLAQLQEQLFAESRFGGTKRILLILQAMDTAGKGGIVTHVMGAMNPHGVQLKSFKAPTPEEKSYDFLWRIEKEVPAAGMVGVFDRSHYEDVLIHRVHRWASPEELERRYRAINEFETRQAGAGTKIVKVMLHISRDEQKARSFKSPLLYFQSLAGSSSRDRSRSFCSSRLMCSMTLTILVPAPVCRASNSLMAR